MENFEAELQQRVDEAVAANDMATLDRLLYELYEKADEADRPLDAAIELRPEYRARISDAGLESNAAFTWANRIARAKRRVAYRIKTANGFSGMKIVSEGDSWWQYPLLLEDVIDHLSGDPDKAIFSLCAAGDLVERMATEKEYVLALEETGAELMLLSGGGNDLLGDGALERVLVKFTKGKKPGDLLDASKLKAAVDGILGHYSVILNDLMTRFPKVHVFGHAYDLPYPANGGKWLGGPLKKAGIPADLWRPVIEVLLDRFSDELKGLQSTFSNFTFVDLRGKVGGELSWHDELHPTNSGFGRAAQEFRTAIVEQIGTGGVEGSYVPRGIRAGGRLPVRTAFEAGSGFEAAGALIVLDPGHGGFPPPNKIGGSSWNNAVGPNGTLEKNMTIDVARRASAVLQGRGHTVKLTRDSDNNLSLANRAAVAKNSNAPVFVSIHFNASDAHNAQGTETFVHTNHSDASRRLCRAVQSSMVAALGLTDRNAGHPGGIKSAGFGVISKASHAAATACVLLEVSFLDRADEEAKLQTVEYREKIAKALADGIGAYLGTGVEGAFGMAEGAEIGDAVELAAVGSSPSMYGVAEDGINLAPWPCGGSTSHLGGYAIADETGYAAPDQGAGDVLIHRILTSEQRYREKDEPNYGDDSANDRGEFAHVDIGEALDFASLGVSFERDVARLRPFFAHVESGTFDMAAFEAFIGDLGLQYFSPAEFLIMGASNQPGASCAGRNMFPARELWPNIGKTARMLDEIRKRLGAPVRILSCYRAPAYNSCIGGESASLHMKFNAIDWRCDSGSVHDWHRTAKEVRRSSPDFLGGVGLYVNSRFIHVDTRGHEANW
jgi:N-acetylmuramoyl-L-alanine amidase